MTEIEPYTGGELVTSADLRADLRNRNTDSWTDVLEQVGDLAARIAPTEFVPDSFRGKVAPVAAAVLYGREVGMPPMTALQTIHSIKGKVGLSAEGMRALVLNAGHDIVTTESTSSQCTMKGRRRGSDEWTSVTWTLADARQAGLLNGSGWKNYPRQMLQARASSELCRLAFPDVLRGLASVEELEDVTVVAGGEPAPAAVTAGTTVQRKTRTKKAAAARAVAPEEPLPEDETPKAGEGVAAPVGGEAREAVAPEPELPEDSLPQDDGGTVAVDGSEGGGRAPSTAAAPEPTLPEDEPPAVDDVVDAEVIEEPGPAPLSPSQRTMILARFGALDVEDRAERLYICSVLVGRDLGSANDLTKPEASSLIDTLTQCKDREALEAVMQTTAAYTARQAGGES